MANANWYKNLTEILIKNSLVKKDQTTTPRPPPGKNFTLT